MKENLIYCEKEKTKCLCHGCSENKTEMPNGTCSGCQNCGKVTEEKCKMIQTNKLIFNQERRMKNDI